MTVTQSGAVIQPPESVLFSANLYQKAAVIDPGNLLISTVAVQFILRVLYLGGRGTTAREIARALWFKDTNVDPSSQTIVNALVQESNKFYVQNGFNIKDGFNQILIEKGVELGHINFGDEHHAREEINDWVKNETDNKIGNLIPPGYLGEDTRILLVSAVKFNDSWKDPFPKSHTTNANFYISPTESILVEVIQDVKFLKYAEVSDLNSTVLLLPYETDRVSFLIIRPNEIDGLPSVEQHITGNTLQNALNSVREEAVNVTLPKFNFGFSNDLKQTLQNLGIYEAFTPHADFSGISDAQVFLKGLQHASFIDVHEDGTNTEAGGGSANTAAQGSRIRTAIAVPTVQFVADRPFLFFILDPVEEQVYFAGRCTRPPKVHN